MPKKDHITIVNVAKEAGVSISAVSRAYNPTGKCSAKMRAKVFAAAEKLGYIPNRLASGIKSRSHLIGILVSEFENPIYLSILKDFTDKIQARNCHSLLINVSTDLNIDDAVSLLVGYRIDGLIITSPNLPDRISSTQLEQNIPSIIFGRPSNEDDIPAVYCNNVESGQLAAQLFIDRGYKKPAFIGGPITASTTTERQRGFINHLAENGYQDWFFVEGGQYSYDAGYHATLRVFESNLKPDALFYADDIMACGGMDALRYELNRKIPEDVGVIGVDDIRLAQSRAYDLTTIRQPFDEMVNATVDTLFNMIETETLSSEQIILPCNMIERGSTRNR